MKVLFVLLCFTLIASTVYGQCVITSAVSSFDSSCTSKSGCVISASLLATLGGLNPACLVATLSNNAAVVIAPTGSGTLNLNLGTGASVYGINSYSNVNITANPGVIINATVSQSMAIGSDLVLQGQTTLSVASGAVVSLGGQLNVAASATLNVAGNVSATTAANIYGTLYFAGTQVKTEAQNAWVILKNAGSVSISGSASASAYVRGNGGIDASVTMSGNATIAAGNSPGTVFINGDLTMSGSSTLEIDVDSSTSYDTLIIKRKFTRNGILHAKFNNYIPDDGDQFSFATHSSADGSFNIAHGNYFDTTLNKVRPNYGDLSTTFTYSSASGVVASFATVLICILFVL